MTKIPFENESEIFKKIDEICPGIIVMTKGEQGVVVSDGKYLYSAKPDPSRAHVAFAPLSVVRMPASRPSYIK